LTHSTIVEVKFSSFGTALVLPSSRSLRLISPLFFLLFLTVLSQESPPNRAYPDVWKKGAPAGRHSPQIRGVSPYEPSRFRPFPPKAREPPKPFSFSSWLPRKLEGEEKINTRVPLSFLRRAVAFTSKRSLEFFFFSSPSSPTRVRIFSNSGLFSTVPGWEVKTHFALPPLLSPGFFVSLPRRGTTRLRFLPPPPTIRVYRPPMGKL